jgi:hypothetical protein
MLVIIMLEQRVVGVVGLEAAGSRIRIPSSKAPGASLGHEPGDTKGQQRSQTDSRDLAMTSANDLEQQRSRRHAVYGMQVVRVNPLGLEASRPSRDPGLAQSDGEPAAETMPSARDRHRSDKPPSAQ